MPDIPTTGEFRDGLALLPGGVTVLTTAGPAGVAGMTASAVCSVTDSPPTVLVCVNRSSFSHRFFAANETLCVNVLKADQQEISALFANPEISLEERFERTAHGTMVTGSPVIDGVLVAMDGMIEQIHDIGTHSLFIVGVKAIRKCQDHDACGGLAYFNRSYHVLGPARSTASSVG